MIGTAYPAFDGQVIFEVSYRTPGSENRATQLYNLIKEQGLIPTETDQRSAATFVMILAATVNITVQTLETPQFRGLANFWAFITSRVFFGERRQVNRDPQIVAQMWALFEDCVSSAVWAEWQRFYVEAQVLYPAPREAVPDSALTEEEQADEELKKNEVNSPATSGPGPERSPSDSTENLTPIS